MIGRWTPILGAVNDVKMDIDTADVDIVIRGLIHANNTTDLKLTGDDAELMIEGAIMAGNDAKLNSQNDSFITVGTTLGKNFLAGSSGGLELGGWKEA